MTLYLAAESHFNLISAADLKLLAFRARYKTTDRFLFFPGIDVIAQIE